MEVIQAIATRDIYETLLLQIEPHAVSAKLFELNVISVDTKDRILSKETMHDKNQLLVDTVLRSEHPEAFDLFKKALEVPNPFLRERLIDSLHHQCVLRLIDEVVEDEGGACENGGNEPTEHDEFGPDNTDLKRFISMPAGAGAESSDTVTSLRRTTQSVNMRKKIPRLSQAYRQQAVDRISTERVERGGSRLTEAALTPDTLRVELGLFEVELRVKTRVSAARSSGYVSNRESEEQTLVNTEAITQGAVNMHINRGSGMSDGRDSTVDPRHSTEV